MTAIRCLHHWDDEHRFDHICHLLRGHDGLHECGDCEATEAVENGSSSAGGAS